MVREGGKAEGWREGGNAGARETAREMQKVRWGRKEMGEEERNCDCSRKGVKFDEYEESGEGRKD